MRHSTRLHYSLRITLIYALVSGVWIFFSDRLLALLVRDHVMYTRIQTYKGWAFVAITAGLIFLLLERVLHRYERAQAEVHASHRRYQRLFESVPTGIYQVTPEGQLLAANPALISMLGYASLQELQVLGSTQAVYADLKARKAQVWELEQEGRLRNAELTLKRKDGHLITVLENARAVQDAQGHTLYYEGTLIDITPWRRALQENQALLQAMLEQMPAVLWTTDKALRFTASLGSGLKALQLKPNQVVGQTLLEYFGTQDQQFPALVAHQRALEGETVSFEIEWGGNTFQTTIRPLLDGTGKTVGTIGLAFDVTENKQLERRLTYLATHDMLTNLYNRSHFEEVLAHELTQVQRYGHQGSVLWLDLDQFKAVNDTLGHQAGDELLIGLSVLLKERVRAADLVARAGGGEGPLLARLGGDEFVILLPHTDAQQAQAAACRLLEEIRRHTFTLQGQPVQVTASLGIATFPDHGSSVEEILAQTDLALYEAKDAGRNCLRVAQLEVGWEVKLEHRLNWLQRIRQGLEENLFTLYAQPIVALPSRQVVQYELLLRLREDLQVYLPSSFLNIAERYGLMSEINRWVVRRAIHLLSHLQQQGDDKVCLAVNLSGKAFGGRQLLPLIDRELSQTGIQPERLILEITETEAIVDFYQSRQFITALKDRGCRFALDDFGVGFSSFYYLKRLPVDYLKIDGSFVQNLTHDSVDRFLVQAMVNVARGLQKQTIAEFVEGEATLELLDQLGVDFAQGYHLGRPRPLEEYFGIPVV